MNICSISRLLRITTLIVGILSFAAQSNAEILLPSHFVPEMAENVCMVKEGNPKLRGLRLGDTIDRLDADYDGRMTQLSSSYLPPSGKAPVFESYLPDPCALPSARECERAPVTFSSDYANWSCMYSAMALVNPCSHLDCKPYSTWSEGVEGDGIGEVVLYPLDSNGMHTMIWIGHAKSKALFEKNNRPKEVRVFVLQGMRYGWNGRFGADNLTVLAEHYVTLEDYYGYQALPVPDYKKSSAFSLHSQRYIGIEIRSVYKGTKWDDTCISHVFELHSTSIKKISEEQFKAGYGENIYKPK